MGYDSRLYLSVKICKKKEIAFTDRVREFYSLVLNIFHVSIVIWTINNRGEDIAM